MDLLQLLRFLPLVIGAALVIFLLFRNDPFGNFSLGKLVVYFVGIIITLFFVGWLVDNFVFSWANDRLSATTDGDYDTFVNSTEAILDASFKSDTTPSSGVAPAPTQAPVIIVVTPSAGITGEGGSSDSSGAVRYTVVAGDTLFSIAARFNTTVNDVMVVNGLTSHIIHPGQELLIPASSAPR